jgi:ribosomal protein S18 acetylase RimI-like enzyme
LRIREFESRDLPGIRSCVVILQDHERGIDPRMPPGPEIADEYVEHMLERCKAWKGTIFVAEDSGRVAGFVCIWSKARSDEPQDGPKEYGLVSDLVVVPEARGTGLGRALLKRAETYARRAKARWLRVGVLSSNRGARALYSAAGFQPYLEYLEKELDVGRHADA